MKITRKYFALCEVIVIFVHCKTENENKEQSTIRQICKETC
jgi:hypothetical protein